MSELYRGLLTQRPGEALRTELQEPLRIELAAFLDAVQGRGAPPSDGRFALGLRLVGIGHRVAAGWPLADLARPALETLRDRTGESAQLYVREGEQRVCLVSLESSQELRTIVTEGARLPLGVGSAGRILADTDPGPRWVASAGERAPGVASVSAPVFDAAGAVVAAVGISGPLDRLGSDVGERLGPAVEVTAAEIGRAYRP